MEITYSVVPDTKAQSVASDLNDTFRYYTGALVEVQKATEREMDNAAKGYRVDASWITHHAAKAAGYQQEMETLIRIARFAGLTKAQIELAASSARVWFQTPEEAAEMEQSA
jgi:hypothetical protein